MKNKLLEEIKHLETRLEDTQTRLRETKVDIQELRTQRDFIYKELKAIYNTLETIKILTKDATIEALCDTRMDDIKNVCGVYIPNKEGEK